MPLTITNSQVGTYMACPRRAWWAYEKGIRKETPGVALSMGTAYHAAIEALNCGRSIDEAVALARSPDLEPVDRELAACMVCGWDWRWSQARVGKIIATEKVFEFKPVKRAQWSVAGKIDAIAELPDGRIAVVEYKTTGDDLSPHSDYWRRLLIDRQISWYVLGARSLGFNVDTVIYDAARKPGVRPRLLSRKKGEDARESMEQFAERLTADIAERPDWYFGRQEIPRIESDIDEAQREMAMFAGMIRKSQTTNRWPRNTNACIQFGTCPYFGPCTANHDPETAGTPSGFKKVSDVHVELTIERTDSGNSTDAE